MKFATDTWRPPPGELLLAPDEVHLWRVHLPSFEVPGVSTADVLSRDELLRLERFRHAGARHAFAAGRTLLRILLGRYTRTHPHRIRLTISPEGKPCLGEGHLEPRVAFNLSHSHSWMVLGFARGRPIGVDLEYRQERFNAIEIARRFFTPEEAEAILHADEATRNALFYDLWVQKEAYLKAIGTGLQRSLKTFSVPLHARENPTLFYPEKDRVASNKEREAWIMYRFMVDPAYSAALAASPGVNAFRHFHWAPEG